MFSNIKKIVCMLVMLMLLMVPAHVSAEGNPATYNNPSEEIIIEETEAPLYMSVPGQDAYNAYNAILGVGSVLILGGAAAFYFKKV